MVTKMWYQLQYPLEIHEDVVLVKPKSPFSNFFAEVHGEEIDKNARTTHHAKLNKLAKAITSLMITIRQRGSP